MAFLRDNDFDAIVGEGAEYAFFDPPRYFSSEHLKLTFRGSLETRELILDEVAKQLNLHPNRFCLFAAMLGEIWEKWCFVCEFFCRCGGRNGVFLGFMI